MNVGSCAGVLMEEVSEERQCIWMQTQFRLIEEHCWRRTRLKKRRSKADEAQCSIRKLVRTKRIIGISLTPLKLDHALVARDRPQIKLVKEWRGKAHYVPNAGVANGVGLS